MKISISYLNTRTLPLPRQTWVYIYRVMENNCLKSQYFGLQQGTKQILCFVIVYGREEGGRKLINRLSSVNNNLLPGTLLIDRSVSKYKVFLVVDYGKMVKFTKACIALLVLVCFHCYSTTEVCLLICWNASAAMLVWS